MTAMASANAFVAVAASPFGRARAGRHSSRAFAFRALVAVLVGMLAWFAFPHRAGADDRISFLADRLRYPSDPLPDDFKVRTKAALALGATDDDRAVEPLCTSIERDPQQVVRRADAIALRRLARAEALPCLSRASAAEKVDEVRAEIDKTIEALGGSSGGGGDGGGGDGDNAPQAVPNAKYYVRIGRVTHNLTRSQAEAEKVVLTSLQAKLASLGRYQLAPARESPEQARAVLSKRGLKGYELGITVEASGSSGNLRVVVKLAILSYPGKALQGEVAPAASTSGKPGDARTEDLLINACAERAIEQFSQNFL